MTTNDAGVILSLSSSGEVMKYIDRERTKSISDAKLFIEKLIVILLSTFFYFETFSQLPICKDSFPTSLLPNNSFENYPGCITDYGGTDEGGALGSSDGYVIPGWNAVWRSSEVIYHNYNCRLNNATSRFDSTIFCHSFVKVPMPLPDGLGFVEIGESPSDAGLDEIHSGKSYITTCLPQPLYAGITYTFSFYFGFGKLNNLICNKPLQWNSISPYGIAIYGRTDCLNYPLDNLSDTSGCLTHFPGWIMLGRILLRGQNQWVQGVIEFTPPVNIYSIAVGADCSNNIALTQNNQLHYYMDKFVLAPKADFAFKTISAVSGNACTGHYVLKAPAYGSATYQWYKDGVLIPGATAQTYNVPNNINAAGNYVANISLPYNNCLNTLPFTVTFSDLNKFSLGDDTTLCAPASETLNVNWRSAVSYLWNDGSTNSTFTVDKSGTYWVQLTDENGCTKTDSINISIKGCDKCELFLPTAFTPNNDGLNDVFIAKPQCANIGLQKFNMSIYNRWGQLVFQSNDINKGWNGRFKNHILSDTYIYIINYSFKQNQLLQKKGTIVLLR